jgi:uncharacterized protein YeaO (DUF488 family)
MLVTHFWPRGMSKARLHLTSWMRELAPSATLLSDWRKGRISWDEYEVRYRQEMIHQAVAIRMLADRAKHSIVTLLCFEREGNPHCHRYLLKELVMKAQIQHRDD